jgi:hypothetical protein
MKFQRKEIIEVTGLIAVVASLIFVGVQLSFDRRVALADQYQRRTEMFVSTNLALIESDAWKETAIQSWESGSRPRWWTQEIEDAAPEYYTPLHYQLNILTSRNLMTMYDNLYYQYTNGFLGEGYWAGVEKAINGSVQGVMFGPLMLNEARNPGFKKFLEELLADYR